MTLANTILILAITSNGDMVTLCEHYAINKGNFGGRCYYFDDDSSATIDHQNIITVL